MVDYNNKIRLVQHGLSADERVLSPSIFTEFICEGPQDIYLPFTTITPSELEGLTFQQERLIRQAAIIMIKHCAILLKLSA